MRRTKFQKTLMQFGFVFLIIISFALADIFVWLEILNDYKIFRTILRNLAIIIIFFTTGLGTTCERFNFSKHLRIFVASQFINFFVVSAFIKLILFFIGYFISIDNWIITGFLALGCISPPLSSAVILTKVSHGNEIAAVVNAGFGCLIGTLLTPLLLLFYVGISCILPVRETLASLLAFGAVPFTLGYLMRGCTISNAFHLPTSLITNSAYLTLIFTSFYQVFLETELVVSAHDVLTTLFIVIVLQVLLMILSIRFAAMMSSSQNMFNSEDLIAIMFCSVNKSLTIGLPLLKILYGGYSHLSQISLPLLIYHPVQLILGALLSPFAHSWISGFVVKS